jgi:hypothetical protein
MKLTERFKKLKTWQKVLVVAVGFVVIYVVYSFLKNRSQGSTGAQSSTPSALQLQPQGTITNSAANIETTTTLQQIGQTIANAIRQVAPNTPAVTTSTQAPIGQIIPSPLTPLKPKAPVPTPTKTNPPKITPLTPAQIAKQPLTQGQLTPVFAQGNNGQQGAFNILNVINGAVSQIANAKQSYGSAKNSAERSQAANTAQSLRANLFNFVSKVPGFKAVFAPVKSATGANLGYNDLTITTPTGTILKV